MKTHTVLWIIFALFLSAAAFGVACGGGDDDDDDSSNGDDDDDDDGPGQGEPGQLNGFVRDFQTKAEVQDATVELVNDETGESFDPPLTATSPANGEVTFEVPEGVEFVGVKVSKTGSTDTVQFHFEVGLESEEFLLVSNATKELIALSLGVELDLTKGVAAGGFYWGDPIDENPIGCSTVSFDPDDGLPVYYFGPDALPATSRDVTGDTPANGQGTNPGRDGKGQAISYYLSLNKELVSDLTIIGRTYDVESTGTVAMEETGIIPRIYENTVTIANVYITKDDSPTDPTPDWCTN